MVNRADAGENDRRLILLTDQYGLVDVIAKGARKGGSRLAGASELMVLAQFTWAEGRARGYIQHVRPVTSFPGLRKNYDGMLAGIAWCDSVKNYLPMGAPADELFELSVVVLRWLEQRGDSIPVLVWGFAKMLTEDGVAPDWMSCMVTGERLTKTPVAFDFSVGGPVDDAEAVSGQVEWVDAEALIGLSRIIELEEPPKQMKRALEALSLLRKVMEFHTDRRMLALGSLISDLRSSG